MRFLLLLSSVPYFGCHHARAGTAGRPGNGITQGSITLVQGDMGKKKHGDTQKVTLILHKAGDVIEYMIRINPSDHPRADGPKILSYFARSGASGPRVDV